MQMFWSGGCYFGCDKPYSLPEAIPEHNVFCYSAVAHILTPSVNLAIGPKLGFKNKCRKYHINGSRVNYSIMSSNKFKYINM